MNSNKSFSTYLSSFFEKNKSHILEEYFTLLSFPSISAKSEHKNDVRSCANWIKEKLLQLKFNTEIWETKKHPVVFAQYMQHQSNKPCLMIYAHYDVQPVDPLALWTSPPFEPEVRDNNVYARGAVDDKGQLAYGLATLEAILKHEGSFPINIKLCIEGEEEIGSPNLKDCLEAHKEEIKADYLLIADAGYENPDEPAVCLGCRGMICATIEFLGSNTDLHSGKHGGIAYNPLHALVEVLSKLHDSKSGKIAVPSFYDDVLMPTAEELKLYSLDFNEKHYEKTFAAKPAHREKDYTFVKANWFRPTLEINGIQGGYAEEGFKTIIPAKACAKISARLVEKQNPIKIFNLIKNFIYEITPKEIQVDIQIEGGAGEAFRAPPDSHLSKIVSEAYSEAFSSPCKFIQTGATIPITSTLATISGAQTLLMGFWLPTDNIHAPNEYFGLDRFEKGMKVVQKIIDKLSK